MTFDPGRVGALVCGQYHILRPYAVTQHSDQPWYIGKYVGVTKRCHLSTTPSPWDNISGVSLFWVKDIRFTVNTVELLSSTGSTSKTVLVELHSDHPGVIKMKVL